jgi:hypothetical protein
MNEFLKAPERVPTIVADIVEHYNKQWLPKA